ncbi:hypothetical protein LNP17_14945 [Klebsiella variicola subsp. variicola]|nr:hypothetical protein [Klebsiella variicola subsp. variicola]
MIWSVCGKTFAKWSQEVTHVDQLPVLVRRAFHDSDAAPKGSVFLSLPMDVMEAMSAIGIGAPSTIDRNAVAGSLPCWRVSWRHLLRVASH